MHPLATTLEYQQKNSYSCCFSILAYALTVSEYFVDTTDIEGQIEEYLNGQSKGYSDRILIAKAIELSKDIRKV